MSQLEERQVLAGRYEILRLLGQGGMGTVYRAMDRTLHREVAIKVLNPQYSADRTFVARLIREARAMARLNHPNIITVFDVLQSENIHAIVMEYFPGRPLNDIIVDRGKLPPKDILNIAIQVTEGLGYAHSQGITHRDIKPGNIMVDESGNAKIADFGIAAATGEASLTRTGQVVGTAQYMSPEQARGEHVDSKSDLFSFGMVLYQMITGTVPFEGDSSFVIIGKLAYQKGELDLDLPSDIPKPLTSLVRRLVKRKPKARVPDAHSLCELLYQVAEELDLEPGRIDQSSGARRKTAVLPPEPREGKTDQRPGKNTIGVAVAFIALILVAAGLFYYLDSERDDGGKKKGILPGVIIEHPEISRMRVSADKLKGKVKTLRGNAEQVNASLLAADVFRNASRLQQEGEAFIDSFLRHADQNDYENAKRSFQKAKTTLNDAEKMFTEAGRQALGIAKSDYNTLFAEALRRKGEVAAAHERADRLNARKHAVGPYEKAVEEGREGNTLLKEGERLAEEKSYLDAEQGVRNAQARYLSAIELFGNAAEISRQEIDHREQQLARQKRDYRERRNGIREIRDRVASARRKAIDVDAKTYAIESFNKASDEELKGDELLGAADTRARRDNYVAAQRKLREAARALDAAHRSYEEAIAKAIQPRPPTERDVRIVNKRLQQLERAYENRSLDEITQIAEMSEAHVQFFRDLFRAYSDIDVSIIEVKVTAVQASAIVSINRLITRSGNPAQAGPSWQRTEIKIMKKQGKWGKIVW